MIPRVGFILVCDKIYPYDVAERFVAKAVEKMREKGVEVEYSGQATLDFHDAIRIARDFWCKDVDLLVLMVGTWIEAPLAIAAIEEVKDLPLLVWSLVMYEKNGERESTGSLPGAGVLCGTLDEIGKPFKFVVGLPEDKTVIEKIYRYARVSATVRRLRRVRIGLVGYASMGMYTATFDHITFRDHIGPEVVHIDNYQLMKGMKQISDAEISEKSNEIRGRFYVEEDVTDKDLSDAVRMYLAFKRIIEDYDLNAISPQCWYVLQKDFHCAACVPLALLAEDGIVASCEADIHLTATMTILNFLTGHPIFYGDVIDVRGNQIYFSSCGFAPLSLAADPASMGIAKHKFGDMLPGLRCAVVLPPGKVTVARLEGRKGTYRMHIATGEAIKTTLRQKFFPATEVKLDGDAEDFLRNLLSQHYALAQADIKDDLLDVCKISKIKPVVT